MSKGNRRTEHSFARIPQATIPRSQFNRSHTHKTTMDSGYLVPIYVDEALPGDTFNLNMSIFARLATPIFPIMDNLTADIQFFFVPYRLVWDNWQRFCGEQIIPDATTDFTIPLIAGSPTAGFTEGSVLDYMGVPPGFDNSHVSALPTRSYNLIWNTWYRDQNLQDTEVVDTDDGPDTRGDYEPLLRRGKRHDYFTSCLPWPSKGPGVELPLGGTAPVTITGTGEPTFDADDALDTRIGISTGTTDVISEGTPTAGDWLLWNDPKLEGQVDLSTATAATINTLREAFQLQKLFERDARGGTRYVELIKSHFQVSSPDQRLQRPEYLGGGSVPIIINTVVQNTQGNSGSGGWSTDVKGSLAAFGTAGGGGIGFSKSFVEHGTILGLLSIRADLTYQHGLARMWSRSTRYDFYWPALANLGEQAVLNKEIYLQDDTAGGAPPDDDNSAVWGYQERWAEYRYHPSRISAQFRSGHGTPLDTWHLAQKMVTLPTLGDTFIKDTPPLQRCLAVQSPAPEFIVDTYFQIKCARPMPIYSVPGLIDHF